MRLIDADALIDFLKKVTVTDGITFETGFKQIITDIHNAPTVSDVRVMTNREKFKEVFDFNPSDCVAPTSICIDRRMGCKDCPFHDWWDKEYKPCFKIKEEFEDD